MRKLALILLLLAPLAFADKRVHKTFGATDRVSITTHNGTITITAWNQPTVDVNATIEATDYPEDVEKTDVKFTQSGGSIRIESDYDNVPSHGSWFGTNRQLPPIHYTISMPATAKLEISAHNARVRAGGLRNDANVDTHNGNVELLDFDGAAAIETHNGDIAIAFARYTKPSRIETHNGSVQVTVPSDARLHIDASGHHLGVDSELGMQTTRVSESHYTGDVNGGGPELRFESHNGTLKLLKR